ASRVWVAWLPAGPPSPAAADFTARTAIGVPRLSPQLNPRLIVPKLLSASPCANPAAIGMTCRISRYQAKLRSTPVRADLQRTAIFLGLFDVQANTRDFTGFQARWVQSGYKVSRLR